MEVNRRLAILPACGKAEFIIDRRRPSIIPLSHLEPLSIGSKQEVFLLWKTKRKGRGYRDVHFSKVSAAEPSAPRSFRRDWLNPIPRKAIRRKHPERVAIERQLRSKLTGKRTASKSSTGVPWPKCCVMNWVLPERRSAVTAVNAARAR